MWIFHSYVSLPEGRSLATHEAWMTHQIALRARSGGPRRAEAVLLVVVVGALVGPAIDPGEVTLTWKTHRGIEIMTM